MDPRLVGLGLLVIVLSGLVAVALEPREGTPPSPLPARAPLFPRSPASRNVTVVGLDFSNGPDRVVATSLQGIVNARVARIFLEDDPPTEIDSRLLDVLVTRYGVVVNRTSLDSAIRTFAPEIAGLIVYDPSVPESVNVGTTLSGIRRGLLVTPVQATAYGAAVGLRVLDDLRDPLWRGLSSAGLDRAAMELLLPAVNTSILGYLRPDHHGPRDYLIATRSFVFYAEAGPLADLDQVRLLREALAATPANSAVIGWVRTTTGAEENFLIQETSRAGKIFVGGEDVPNLSLLSAFPATTPLRQSRPSRSGPLEDKVYVSFAIPDGDNLDFVRGRMYDLWRQPRRGTVPIGWSISPALVDLAPVYLELLYADATSNDTFIAGPSGVGYAYPSLFPERARAAFLSETATAMRDADLRISWLLNTYRPYEVPYPPDILDMYARDVMPAGLLLDYGDRPTGESAWTVRDTSVMRSFHYWGSLENLQEKVRLELEARDGPRFIVMALYPFTKDLSDIARAAERVSALAPGRVELVPIEHLFSLLGQWLREQATGSPWSDVVFPLAAEALVPAIGIVLSLWVQRARIRVFARSGSVRPAAYSGLAGLSMSWLVVSGTIRVVEANFWDLLGAVGAVAAIAILLLIPRRWTFPGSVGWIAAVVALAAGVGALGWSAWGLVPIGLGVALLARRVRRSPSFHETTWFVSTGLGAAGALLTGWNPWISPVLLAGGVLGSLPIASGSDPPRRAGPRRLPARAASSVIAILPLAALLIPWTAFFSRRMDGDTAVLVRAAVLALGLAPGFGLVLSDLIRIRWRELAGSVVLVLVAANFLGGPTLLATTLLAFALLGAMSVRLGRSREGTASHDGVAATGLTITFVTLARIQPVYYSVYVWAGPGFLEYALYHPLVTLAFVAGFAAIAILSSREATR